jgi:hypothetical protein
MDEREAGESSDVVRAGDVKRSRRMLLAGGLGAVAAVALDAVAAPRGVQAASVQLGATNSTNKPTTIRSSQEAKGAKAIVGRTTRTRDTSTGAGVQGISDGKHGTGVMGTASKGESAAGVWGRSSSGYGVYGSGPTGVEGYGLTGVAGVSNIPGSAGVIAYTAPDAEDGVGLYARADGANGTGIYAAGTEYAAYLSGDVAVTGTLQTTTAITQANHPDDPGKWYRQALVGSFEQITVLSGNVRTDRRGRAVVKVLPLFARTHRDVRYQLTAVGAPASLFVAEELAGGRFVIGSDVPRLRVSWQITGVRRDAAARRQRFSVEAPKRATRAPRVPRLTSGVAGANERLGGVRQRLATPTDGED